MPSNDFFFFRQYSIANVIIKPFENNKMLLY